MLGAIHFSANGGLRPQGFRIQYSVFRNQNADNFSLREKY